MRYVRSSNVLPRANSQPHNLPNDTLHFAGLGWRLLPIKPSAKTPLIKEWQKHATSDIPTLQAWAKQFHQCNWALATGTGSGVFVMDADSDDAIEAFNRLGRIPRTLTVKTSRGKHFYFKYESGLNVQNSAGKVAAGLDVRGEGGYVLIPSSVHPSGAIYKVVDAHPPAEPPTWLLNVLRYGPPPARGRSPIQRSLEAPTQIAAGGRNSHLTSMAGSMQRRGFAREAIEAALLTENDLRCDPALGHEEVQSIVNSVSRYSSHSDERGGTELVISERPFAQMVPDAEALLKGRQDERIFQTPLSRRLVRIVRHKQVARQERDVQRDPEACLLVDVDAQYLQLALGRSGQVFKPGKHGLVVTDAPRQLAEMILSSVRTSPDMTSWFRLRKLAATPILLADGTIVAEPGYDAASLIWIDTQGIDFIDFGATGPRMTPGECRQLIEAHIQPFACMYPFAREHAGQLWHETGAFAAVLSALMSIDDRHNLPAVPMHCVSAPTQSCGKTRLVQAISCAVTGKQPTIVTYDGAEEFGKHVPVLLGKGDSVICVDNVIMPVNNARLAALLTQEHSFTYRVLGQSEDRTVENNSVLFATGVNLQLSGDMPTRCLLIRIEPDHDRPEQKSFPFDQVDRARELFPKAVMAIKAVLRAHQLAGYPGQKALRGASRFRVWDRRVRAAIVWVGYADPLITQDTIRADDPIRSENLRALWILRNVFSGEPFLTCDLSSRVAPDSVEVLKQITGHKGGEELNERKAGKYLSHIAGRWFEGIRLNRTGKNPGGRIEWQIEAKLDDATFLAAEEPL